MERDIIERLMDFEQEGLTAQARVKLREDAAIEIFKLRADVHSLRGDPSSRSTEPKE